MARHAQHWQPITDFATKVLNSASQILRDSEPSKQVYKAFIVLQRSKGPGQTTLSSVHQDWVGGGQRLIQVLIALELRF